MKFKKVEVSAFRIYDRPEDGTFDFTTKTGETANFVSLYAPNGFGKTSFYDAVEWGMTNTIGRFLLKTENKKLANSQEKENKNKNAPQDKDRDFNFIKNYNSELKTYVTITDNNNVVRNQTLNRKGKFDFKFDEKPISKFHKVVLSQEWISAFLKEDDGELRYEKFIKNPELIQLDAYYKNLIGLINVNKEKISKLRSDIGVLRAKITVTEESNLLDKINESIDALKSFEEKLMGLNISSTQQEVIEFRNKITPRIVELEYELIRNISSSVSYKIAQNGNQDVPSLDLYYSKKEIVESTRKTLSEISSNLKNFKTLGELVNQKNGITAKRETETKNKEDLATILGGFSEYQRIVELINVKSNERITQNEKLGIRILKVSYYEQENVDYKSKIESSNVSLLKINGRIKEIPNLEKEFGRINTHIKENEKLVKLLTSEFKEKEIVKKSNERVIDKYGKIIEYVGKYDYNLIDDKDFIETGLENIFSKKIESIKTNLVSIESLEKSQELIAIKIDQQKLLSSNISDFIAKGLEIAQSIKKSNCPLCNHLHGSYDDLEKEISSNKLLDEILQELFSEQKVIDTNIIQLKKIIEEANTELISVYSNHILNLNDNSKRLNIKVLQSQIVELKTKLRDYENNKLELIDKLGNLSAQELRVNLKNQITVLEDNKKTIQYFDSKNMYLLNKRKEQIELIGSQTDLLKKDIDELKLNEQFTIIKGWFKENHHDVKINRENLDQLIVDNKTLLASYSSDIEKFVFASAKLEKDLSSYKKEDLEIQETRLKEEIERELIKINSYQDLIKNLTGNPIIEITKESLSKLFLDKETELNENKIRLNSIKREYAKLEKYVEIVEPYLQSAIAKINLLEKEKELSIWVKKVTPTLYKERIQIRTHLEKKIKNFFHTDLINKIYKRIDPHPDFKNVEFKADFGSDNPRLDVFVTDKKLEKTLIPNLYFSTAQINILSLSIFLASALNSKEYDCILIDDPIQSLDSINVLSTIDLFRSIIVNQDKQIILSTHDENFHNLLKKKIPKDLFKSKFLELESFGKVKSDMN